MQPAVKKTPLLKWKSIFFEIRREKREKYERRQREKHPSQNQPHTFPQNFLCPKYIVKYLFFQVNSKTTDHHLRRFPTICCFYWSYHLLDIDQHNKT